MKRRREDEKKKKRRRKEEEKKRRGRKRNRKVEKHTHPSHDVWYTDQSLRNSTIKIRLKRTRGERRENGENEENGEGEEGRLLIDVRTERAHNSVEEIPSHDVSVVV